MDLSFTPEERAFREEMRRFFRTEIPAEIREKAGKGEHVSKADLITTQQAMNKAGLATPHWPRAWGGRDWTPVQTYIWLDEMQTNSVPAPLAFNTSMVGPVIAEFGSEAQKQRFLPATANLDIWWCQGFSEPGAGSDLAGLRTSAVRDGDEWVVNGQKTWTTLAQHADWIFCLCRTDPNAAKKQQGISFILIDMKTPGITVRPIQTLDGGHEVNEVWFDEVRVPYENLVGEENKGWDYAKFLLGNERTGIARVGVSKARLLRLRELAKLERIGDKPLIEDRHFREKLTALEIELRALEMTQLRVVAGERDRPRGVPNPMSSILKLKGSEIQQATTELLMELVGPYAMPYHAGAEPEGDNDPQSIGPEYAAEAAPTYFNWRKISIYGGSNEIQRNILAKAILGF
ncbi:acyl-CoA dehydrogenase family protein [Acidisphaera sp. L21]|uniref:acyl-CoA dehydrogenase family protein n=1 Tax=Acidisphaera sp. L21 TaxID=1641851 RepID=UPI00131B2CD1|nr:acyl-CoA dehydrogenase family protein [Acidisphaera sp. L21]